MGQFGPDGLAMAPLVDPLDQPLSNGGRQYFWRKAGKALKKSQKTGKAQKFCGKPEKNMCRKLENAIFKSQKPKKRGKYGGNQKTHFKICGNRKSLFGSCRKPEKTIKTTKSCRNWKIRKKATESRKGNLPPLKLTLEFAWL